MAVNTDTGFRNQVVYSVYVRNHTPEGTFEGVRKDLNRIKNLGVDIIWFLPIHPIGVEAHKGTLGCPYAISDYRGVNSEYGTIDDFKKLVDEIHKLDMKCIIDVVYNHTSPDSVLAKEHPEWFYKTPEGEIGNKEGGWSDVVDLDYSKKELWDYQIETLKMWAGIVDGFRCDVASLIPIDFWMKAREEVENVRKGCIWLAESVHPDFIKGYRGDGHEALSDGELYQAFDITYDYDIFPTFMQYLKGEIPLSRYIEAVNQQEYIYPKNYVKLRFLENHDQLRAAFAIPDDDARLNHTAFIYFQKGLTLLYGGQENSCMHMPSLFDKDTVDFSGEDLQPFLHHLYEIKKDPIFAEGNYNVKVMDNDVVFASYIKDETIIAGVFGLKGKSALVPIENLVTLNYLTIPDGIYTNLIDGSDVDIQFGTLSFKGKPIIFKMSL